MNIEIPRLVDRPRLTRRLARVREVPLTLVSGPAGSGKSTLLKQWAREASDPIGWIEADEVGQQPWPALLRTLDDLGLDLPAAVAGLLPDAGSETGSEPAATPTPGPTRAGRPRAGHDPPGRAAPRPGRPARARRRHRRIGP